MCILGCNWLSFPYNTRYVPFRVLVQHLPYVLDPSE